MTLELAVTLDLERRANLLVVDDDPAVRMLVANGLPNRDLSIATAEDGPAALETVRSQRVDLIILDNFLPGMNGLAVLEKLRAEHPRLPVIFITASGDCETAIEATKLGAFDYIAKPLDLSLLSDQIQRALSVRRMMRMPVGIRSETEDTNDESLLIGSCPAMQEVYKSIGRIAVRDVSTLIVGEAGTEKDRIAAIIHKHSPRGSAPLLSINCSDYSPEALEAQLFGQLATSHQPERPGKLEAVADGTLVVHELAALSLPLQSKLLRVLRDREFERFGDGKTCRFGGQVVATTSRDLKEAVEEGRFRTDLYYWLSACQIEVPPLRDRVEDIRMLVGCLVRQIAREFNSPIVNVAEDAYPLLESCDWPGNMEQLESVIRRAVIEGKGGVIDRQMLAGVVSAGTRNGSSTESTGATDWGKFTHTQIEQGSQRIYADAVAEMERNVLLSILDYTSGNQVQASRLLGMTRASLRKKIRMLGIQIDRKAGAAHLVGVDSATTAKGDA